ncbi:MAG: sugar phosphate isomerase/epimerase [Bacteroidales bacterium]|jgi:sugar phosphate isomerase/epimerase|nr:sugar phosphate isomerase/epimerase [Bacteroidales bacterium]
MKKRFSFRMLVSTCIFSGAMLFTACNAAPKKDIGLQLYSLRDLIGKDVPGILDSVGKVGYTSVEAASYGDGKFYGMEPAAFKALCKKNGLNFVSSHCGRDCPDDLSDEATWAWWKQCIDAHAAAGVKFLVQPSMGGKAYQSEEGLLQYCKYFNKIGEMCNEKGILFGYHNHSGEFKEFNGVKIYDIMLKNTNPKNVMFEIDLYWAVEGGVNPVDYFKQYPGRFKLWHVKDVKEIGASGKMDFKTIFENAKGSGMNYIIVEQEAYSMPQIQSIKASHDYLMKSDFVKKKYTNNK